MTQPPPPHLQDGPQEQPASLHQQMSVGGREVGPQAQSLAPQQAESQAQVQAQSQVWLQAQTQPVVAVKVQSQVQPQAPTQLEVVAKVQSHGLRQPKGTVQQAGRRQGRVQLPAAQPLAAQSGTACLHALAVL